MKVKLDFWWVLTSLVGGLILLSLATGAHKDKLAPSAPAPQETVVQLNPSWTFGEVFYSPNLNAPLVRSNGALYEVGQYGQLTPSGEVFFKTPPEEPNHWVVLEPDGSVTVHIASSKFLGVVTVSSLPWGEWRVTVNCTAVQLKLNRKLYGFLEVPQGIRKCN